MEETEIKELENKALRDAYGRVSKAVEGLSDVPIPMEVENELGEVDSGMQIPLAKIRAGDTKRLCLAIPPGKKTLIVEALLKGTRKLDSDLIVQQQSTCLHHLLKVVKPYIPTAVIAQPPSDEQPEAEEEIDGKTE